MFDFALYHAWLIPLLPALSFLVIGLFTRQDKKTSAVIGITAIGASFLLSLGVVGAVLANRIVMAEPFVMKTVWARIGGMELGMGALVDPLTAMMLVVVTTVALMVNIYSVGYMEHDPGMGRFFAFLSLFAASMLGLVISVNFLQMYVFWEGVGLCSYLLIGFYYYKISAREAAKKAFITTRIGDFGMLLGILLLQITFGTVDFIELKTLVPDYIWVSGTSFLTVIGLLLFIGPIGKSGQFPLHVWLPDAMEGPTPVSALIHAATMVVAGVYLIGRAYFIFAELPIVLNVIAWLGGFTAFFAATIAITQRPFKRILAYSTISQLGYMMLALGVGSLTASMFHLMTHAFFKALMFLCAGAVIEAMHEEADIFKMGGLRHRMPVTFKCMAIGVVAIAGLPPFAGFFSKDAILAAAAEVSFPLYLLASVTAFLTAFYMSRLLFVAFFGEVRDDCPAQETNAFMRWPLVVLAALSVVSGAWGYFAGFGDWVFYGVHEEEAINWTIAGSSIVLSLAAMWLAYQIYVEKRWSSFQIARRLGVLYDLSFHAYYIDEIYAFVRELTVDKIGRLALWVDTHIVDGVVHGLGRLTKGLSVLLALPQNGDAQRYVAIFYTGVIALVAYSLFYAVKILSVTGGAF
ncbi:MAG: NADH-quinone oxidoreductase subunit L [Schwartzia sp.]|nr:NADH-quinone oxidoreductase subunit L [Schwartzia sp. (in: firmicutes)]